MSCKPRSPVGLVNQPAKHKCESESARTRCLTRKGLAATPLQVGPVARSGANERARRGGRANRPKRDTEGWLARREGGCTPAGGGREKGGPVCVYSGRGGA